MTGLAWERVITDEGRAALRRIAEAAERAAESTRRLDEKLRDENNDTDQT